MWRIEGGFLGIIRLIGLIRLIGPIGLIFAWNIKLKKIAHGCKFPKLAAMSDFYFKQGKFALHPIIVIGPISPIGLI